MTAWHVILAIGALSGLGAGGALINAARHTAQLARCNSPKGSSE